MNRRLSRFLTVGAMGFVLQLGALALLTMAVGWPYEPATAVAVALAVLHNFWWHERWTWGDRAAGVPGLAGRIARYHVATGATSIGGNLIFTAMGVELFGWHPIVANVAAVAASSLANFLVFDRWVFARLARGDRGGPRPPVTPGRDPSGRSRYATIGRVVAASSGGAA